MHNALPLWFRNEQNNQRHMHTTCKQWNHSCSDSNLWSAVAAKLQCHKQCDPWLPSAGTLLISSKTAEINSEDIPAGSEQPCTFIDSHTLLNHWSSSCAQVMYDLWTCGTTLKPTCVNKFQTKSFPIKFVPPPILKFKIQHFDPGRGDVC